MLAERGPDLSFANVKFLIKVEKQFAFCFDVQMRSYDGYIMGKKEVSHEPLMFHIDAFHNFFLIISFCLCLLPPRCGSTAESNYWTQ